MKNSIHSLICLLFLLVTACRVEVETAEPTSPAPTTKAEQKAAANWLMTVEPERYGELSAEEVADLETIRIDGSEKPGSIDPLRDESVLDHLAAFPNLRSLALWTTRISDFGLSKLARLENLESLEVGGWGVRYTDDGVSHLAALVKLKHLKLTQAPGITDLSMKTVAGLPSLEYLGITYTKISNQGLTQLLQSPSLKTVNYGWARESEVWLRQFQKAHPNCPFTIE